MTNPMTLLASSLVLAFSIAQAQAADPVGLFVVPGIFVDDGGGAANLKSSKIHPSFREALSKAHLPQLVARLQQQAQARFETLTPTIDSKNRLRTLALSVQVARATRYQINKPDATSDIYLPITLSLYFSNPMTGEVLQSFSQTRYEIFTSPRQQLNASDEAMVHTRYREGLSALLDQSLTQARQQFSPYLVEAKVADNWRGYVVLDKGGQAGIGKGDLMEDAEGNEIRIEHAGQYYAIAVPVLGRARDGGIFSRPSMMKLSDVKKPRVLTLVSDGNTDLPDAVVTQLFADKLGSKAPFASLPLNGNFSQVQATLDRTTNIGHQVSGQRSLPEYVIRLVVPPVRHYELPTNVDYKVQRHYRGWAFGELLSLDGRVLYAADVSQPIDDTVSLGVGFADADRREVVLKNTLNELADRFGKEIRFKPQTLTLSEAGNGSFTIDDNGGVLQPGQTIRVYHSVGRPGGITEDVLVPTWEARVQARDGRKVMAQKILEIAGNPPAPEKGDVVLINSISTDSSGGERVAYCPASKAQVGSVAIERFDLLAYATAAQSPLNLVNIQLPELLKGKIGGQSGFRKDLSLSAVAHDQCLEALYRTDVQAQPCDGGVCNTRYAMRAAYRLKQGEQLRAQKVLEHGFATSGYPEVTGGNARAMLQSIQLEQDARGLMTDVVKQLQ